MLPDYNQPSFAFFHAPHRRPSRNTIPRSPIDGGWTPELLAAVWLNRNFTTGTANALIEGFSGGQRRTYQPGDLLDEEQEGVAILLSGQVKLLAPEDHSEARVEFAVCRAGQWLHLPRLLARYSDFKQDAGSSAGPVIAAVGEATTLSVPMDTALGWMMDHLDFESFVATQVFIWCGVARRDWRRWPMLARNSWALLHHFSETKEGIQKTSRNIDNITLPHMLEYPERWHELLDQIELLSLLDPPDRSLLLQLCALHSEAPQEKGATTRKIYLSASDSNHTAAVVLHGNAQSYLPPSGGSTQPVFNVNFKPGSLLGYERLASDEELARVGLREDSKHPLDPLKIKPPGRDTDLLLVPGSITLEMDWRVLRWLMFEKKQIWARVCAMLDRRPLEGTPETARVFVFFCQKPNRGSTTLAHGTALALARAMSSGDPDEDPQVCLIDVQKQDNALALMRQDRGEVPWMTGDLEDGTWDGFEYKTHILRAYEGGAVELAWCKDTMKTDALVNLIRRQGKVRYILVSVDYETSPVQGDPRALLAERLTAFDDTVVWLTESPCEDYSATSALPGNIIQAEFLSPDCLKAERRRVRQMMVDKIAPRKPSHRDRIRHLLRVPWDPKGAKAFSDEIKLRYFFSDDNNYLLKQCFERLARMIRGRSVGVALGGGGAWGFTHIALLKALEDNKVPIDYIAGTSFGAMIAGLYAAGQQEALSKLVEWSDLPDGIDAKENPNIVDLWEYSTKSRLTTRVTAALFGSHHLQLMVDDILRETVDDTFQAEDPKLRRVATRWLCGFFPGHARSRDDPWSSEDTAHSVATASDTPDTLLMGASLIPFLPVGTNAASKENHNIESLLSHGTVGLGVRYASCLPPAYPALDLNGEHLLDGALVAFVPAGRTRRFGADFVIASNVIPTDSRILHNLQMTSSGPFNAVLKQPREQVQALLVRLMDGLKGFFMMSWKAGQDQSDINATYLIDMQPQRFDIMEFWRGREIAGHYLGKFVEGGLGAQIRKLYDHPEDWQDKEAWYVKLDD